MKILFIYSIVMFLGIAVMIVMFSTPWLLVFIAVIAIVIFLFCPPDRLFRRFRGTGYFGSRPRILTAVAARNGRLALALQQNGRVQIHITDSKGRFGAVTSGRYDADPAWDPQCRRLAYVSLNKEGTLDLHVLDLESHSDVILIQGQLISLPQWSHNGESLLFQKNRTDRPNECVVYRMDLATSTETALTEVRYNRPQGWGLLANGDRLAYVTADGVWIKSLTEGLENRVPIEGVNLCMVAGPSNGDQLFICDSPSSSEKHALLADLVTGEVRHMLKDYMRYALWSPSGRWLAIPSYEKTHVLTMPPKGFALDGKENAVLLDGIAVCWCSDTGLAMIRPNMREGLYLDLVDMQTMSVTRLYSSEETNVRSG